MDQERPVNLDLFKFRFPIMAVVSIIHRISGVVLFLLLPALLYILHQSLISPINFSNLLRCLSHELSKIVLLLVIAAALFHLVAGIRHLVMDCGVLEGKKSGRVTAWLVIVIVLILTVLVGVWLW